MLAWNKNKIWCRNRSWLSSSIHLSNIKNVVINMQGLPATWTDCVQQVRVRCSALGNRLRKVSLLSWRRLRRIAHSQKECIDDFEIQRQKLQSAGRRSPRVEDDSNSPPTTSKGSKRSEHALCLFIQIVLLCWILSVLFEFHSTNKVDQCRYLRKSFLSSLVAQRK